MALRALQLKMQTALLEATGASADASAALDEVGAAIVDAPPLSRAARLEIYRHAYRSRLIEALADTHAMLQRALGDEDFQELGARFVAAHPSVHRSIRWYGAELAQFLERTAPYCEHPLLAELARFEWTLAGVFDAPDAEPIDRSALLEIAPEGWGALQFEFHPSLRRLELAWNTVAVWRALSEEDSPPAPEALEAPIPWLLWRQRTGEELKNFFRSLEPDEAVALDTARSGASFAEVCAALRGTLCDEDIPLRAATFIGTWAASGMLIGLTTDG